MLQCWQIYLAKNSMTAQCSHVLIYLSQKTFFFIVNRILFYFIISQTLMLKMSTNWIAWKMVSKHQWHISLKKCWKMSNCQENAYPAVCLNCLFGHCTNNVCNFGYLVCFPITVWLPFLHVNRCLLRFCCNRYQIEQL